MKTYTLRLTDDATGEDVFSRPGITQAHVDAVAGFLTRHWGLILAAQGVANIARGAEAVFAGFEQQAGSSRTRRVVRRRRRA